VYVYLRRMKRDDVNFELVLLGLIVIADIISDVLFTV
jgi:hypothetical protein